MQLTTLNAIFCPIAVCLFWLTHHMWTTNPVQQTQSHFSFTLRKSNRSVFLVSESVRNLLESENERAQGIPTATSVVGTFIKSLCEVNIHGGRSSVLRSQCCYPSSASEYLAQSVSQLKRCLLHTGDLGPVPLTKSANSGGSEVLPEMPPPFVHSQVYMDQPGPPNRTIGCHVATWKRAVLYRLLRHWIQLAETHGLVWWINHGTLLGSIRHGDIIPYDHDMDVAILEPDEHIIQALGSDWSVVDRSKITLVKRIHECRRVGGSHVTCEGLPVRLWRDLCSFCGPVARLVTGYTTFLDIFVVRPRLIIDPRGSATSWTFSLSDDGLDQDDNQTKTYLLSDVFPLSRCPFMGLSVPCPNNPGAVLTHTYGPNFMRPNKLCSQRYGYWYST